MDYPIIDAFSNTVRLQLICCLANGPKNVQELIGTCGLSQSAVSQHLQKLRLAGLVRGEKNGKFVYYSLAYPKVATIAKQLQDLVKEVK